MLGPPDGRTATGHGQEVGDDRRGLEVIGAGQAAGGNRPEIVLGGSIVVEVDPQPAENTVKEIAQDGNVEGWRIARRQGDAIAPIESDDVAGARFRAADAVV